MLIGNTFGTEKKNYLCLLDFYIVKYKLHLYLDLLIFHVTAALQSGRRAGMCP